MSTALSCEDIVPKTLSSLRIILAAVFLVITTYFTIEFIRKGKHQSCLHRFGISFALISILIIFLQIMEDLACLVHIQEQTSSFYYLSLGLWYIQFSILLLIFFAKAYYIFIGTNYTLSKSTIMTFIIIFTLNIFSIVFMMFFPTFLLASLTSLINGILITFVVLLYLSKLVSVNRGVDTTHIIKTHIIKTTVLMSISLMSTVITALLYIYWRFAHGRGSYRQNVISEITSFVGLIDEFLRFLCIMLLYKIFAKYYRNLCSFMHNKCELCWKHCGTKSNTREQQLQKYVTSVEAKKQSIETKNTAVV
eukprot:89227_1